MRLASLVLVALACSCQFSAPGSDPGHCRRFLESAEKFRHERNRDPKDADKLREELAALRARAAKALDKDGAGFDEYERLTAQANKLMVELDVLPKAEEAVLSVMRDVYCPK